MKLFNRKNASERGHSESDPMGGDAISGSSQADDTKRKSRKPPSKLPYSMTIKLVNDYIKTK